MAEPAARRKKRHAAASARILTAGLSSAAALGMVAGMAATRTDPEAAMAEPAAPGTPGQVAAPPPEQTVLVIRRHWLTAPSAALPVTGAAAPQRAAGGTTAAAATPTRPAAPVIASPRPAPRPVTRTRGS